MSSACLFCRIIQGEIPSRKVYEDELMLAFHDVQPVAPVHVLLVPKQHVESLASVTEGDAVWISHLMAKTAEIARTLGVQTAGYRVVTNHGEQAGQTVPHLHFHLLAGRSMSWPPG